MGLASARDSRPPRPACGEKVEVTRAPFCFASALGVRARPRAAFRKYPRLLMRCYSEVVRHFDSIGFK
jgi:hypothetical protein